MEDSYRTITYEVLRLVADGPHGCDWEPCCLDGVKRDYEDALVHLRRHKEGSFRVVKVDVGALHPVEVMEEVEK